MSSPKAKKSNTRREDWSNIADYFARATDMPPAERRAYLDQLRKIDPRAADEVESLLKSHESAETFLSQPLLEVARPNDSGFPPNTVVGDFKIIHPIGAGGFATVYLARQLSLQRDVALKISANLGSEGRVMAKLEHDNIVTVFSEFVEEVGNFRVVAMQYVPGTSLYRLMKQLSLASVGAHTLLAALDEIKPPSTLLDPKRLAVRDQIKRYDYVEAVLWMGARLAEALAYAHSQNVLHLDIKPGNILITPYGDPLLADFNVSVDQQQSAGKNLENFGGTPDYMPPEQLAVFNMKEKAEGIEALDGRADIYALGKVLQELLQFAHPDLWAENRAQVQPILNRATAPDRNLRFPTAKAMAEVLDGALEHSQMRRRLPPLGRWMRWLEKHPLSAITLFALLPQLLGSLVNITYNSTRIVSELNVDQGIAFKTLTIWYNAFVYPVGVGLWLWVLWNTRRSLALLQEKFPAPLAIAHARRRMLRLPYWVLAITSIGWIPGALFFPYGLAALAGPISGQVVSHFVVSFSLSWLIAISHSFLESQYLVLRLLYPRFWIGTGSQQQTARREWGPISRRTRFFPWLIPLVPLLGVATLIAIGPGKFDREHFDSLRQVLLLLLTLGGLGLQVSFHLMNRLTRTTFALCGAELHRTDSRGQMPGPIRQTDSLR